MQKIDLLGTTDWTSADQQEAYNWIHEYACIFSWNDLDLGKTLIVNMLMDVSHSDCMM